MPKEWLKLSDFKHVFSMYVFSAIPLTMKKYHCKQSFRILSTQWKVLINIAV